MSRRSSGSPPVRIVRHSGAKVAISSMTLNIPRCRARSIGEVLRADLRCAAGVEIAVLACEVAAIGQVPGDDVRSGERCHSARDSGSACPQRTARRRRLGITCRRIRGPHQGCSRPLPGPALLPRESLDAGPRHGADEFGNLREPRFCGGRPAGMGSPRLGSVGALPLPGIIAVNGQPAPTGHRLTLPLGANAHAE